MKNMLLLFICTFITIHASHEEKKWVNQQQAARFDDSAEVVPLEQPVPAQEPISEQNNINPLIPLIRANDCAAITELLNKQPALLELVNRNGNGNTPIMIAAIYSELKTIKLLKETYKANSKILNVDGFSIIHCAIDNKDKDALPYIWQELEDIHEQGDGDGNTPLLYAIEHGKMDAIEFLLKNKANAVATNSINEECLLHIAASCLHKLPETAVRILQYLYDNHRQLFDSQLERPDKLGRTPLMTAIETGTIEVVQWFLDHDAKINIRDRKGNSLLHIAVLSNHPGMLKFIFERFPGLINIADNNGFAPPFDTIDNEEAFKFFIKNIDGTIKDSDNNSLFHSVINRYGKTEIDTCIKLLDLLYEHYPHLINSNLWAVPLILHAASTANVTIVKWLLAHGANLEQKNWGFNIIHYSTYANNIEMLDYVWNRKEITHLRNTASGHHNNTALLCAAMSERYHAVLYLLQNADDTHIFHKNSIGKNIFDLVSVESALQKKNKELAKWLLLRGAPLTQKAIKQAQDFDLANKDTKDYQPLEPQLKAWRAEYLHSLSTDVTNAEQLPAKLSAELPDVVAQLPLASVLPIVIAYLSTQSTTSAKIS